MSTQEKNQNHHKNKQLVPNGLWTGYAKLKMVIDANNETNNCLVVDCDRGFAKLCALSKNEIFGKKIQDLFPDIIASSVWQTAWEKVRQGKKTQFEFTSDDSKRLLLTIFNNKNGEFDLVLQDLTNVKGNSGEWQEQLKGLNEIKTVIDSLQDIICCFDQKLRICYINGVIEKEMAVPPEDFLGKKIRKAGINSRIAIKYEKEVKQVFVEARERDFEFQFKHNNRVQFYFVRLMPQFNSENEVISVVAVTRNITENKSFEERVKYLSFNDKLTGLYNRAYFEEELQRLDTMRQLPLSIVVIDVNGLKLANDAFGRQKGDRLLLKLARILKSVCRKEDIVCRWGGDEFIVLLPKTSEQAVAEICNRIKEACQNDKVYLMPLSIAIGAASKNQVSDDIQEVIKEAEDRMYRNKLLENKSSRSSIIAFLQGSLRERTLETEEHERRLKDLAYLIGKEASLSDSQMDELILLANLHDIGKIAVPEHIILKPMPLDDEEWLIMKKHPEMGYRIAQATPEMSAIAEEILSHHERWDGNGYPRKLKAGKIPFMARILAIIDAYDVMTHDRPYKKAISPEAAIEELKRGAGSQFDPELVQLFIQTMNNYNQENDAKNTVKIVVNPEKKFDKPST